MKKTEEYIAKRLESMWDEINWIKSHRKEYALMMGLQHLWLRDYKHQYLSGANASIASERGTVKAALLVIDLDEEGRLVDTMHILERVDDYAHRNGFTGPQSEDYTAMRARDFVWEKEDKRMHVRICLYNSKYCKFEPTGEKEDMLKIVCS